MDKTDWIHFEPNSVHLFCDSVHLLCGKESLFDWIVEKIQFHQFLLGQVKLNG